MPTTRRLPVVLFLAALMLSACARGQTADPTATPAPATTIAPATTTQTSGAPETPESTNGPPVDRPGPRRCAASVLRGSVQGSEGAAGTAWTTIQLRNASARTCTVGGIPQVRLLGGQGQPVTAPSAPGGPGGAVVTLWPGEPAQFDIAVANVCDRTIVGSRLRVTLPHGQGSVVVGLGGQAAFGTCRRVSVRALEPSPFPGIWDVRTWQQASELQVAVDNGHQPWRCGPDTLVRLYAQQVLHVAQPLVHRIDASRFSVTKPGRGVVATVTVTQPFARKPCGVWVVTKVTRSA
jgi:hypothetical protein